MTVLDPNRIAPDTTSASILHKQVLSLPPRLGICRDTKCRLGCFERRAYVAALEKDLRLKAMRDRNEELRSSGSLRALRQLWAQQEESWLAD